MDKNGNENSKNENMGQLKRKRSGISHMEEHARADG